MRDISLDNELCATLKFSRFFIDINTYSAGSLIAKHVSKITMAFPTLKFDDGLKHHVAYALRTMKSTMVSSRRRGHAKSAILNITPISIGKCQIIQYYYRNNL